MGGARAPLWGVFGRPGSPRAPRGPARTILGGLGGGPGGGRSIIGGSRGAPFRTRVRCKIIKKRWKYVYNRHMGFPGGVPPRRQKIARRTRALTISRGGRKQGAGPKGLNRSPLGAPKKPGGHWRNGSWKPPTSKCIVFNRKYSVIQKSPNHSQGGSGGRFSRNLGAPGGSWDPPGGSCRFSGGSRGAFRGPVRVPGGGPGGPGGTSNDQAGLRICF